MLRSLYGWLHRILVLHKPVRGCAAGLKNCSSLKLTGNVAAKLTNCSSADQLQPKIDRLPSRQLQVQMSDCSWADRSKLGWQIAGDLNVCSWTHWLLTGCVQQSWQCASIADRLQASWQLAAQLSGQDWQLAAKLSGWQNAAAFGCRAALKQSTCSLSCVLLLCITGHARDMLQALCNRSWKQPCVTTETPIQICCSYKGALAQNWCIAALLRRECMASNADMHCKRGWQRLCVTTGSSCERVKLAFD